MFSSFCGNKHTCGMACPCLSCAWSRVLVRGLRLTLLEKELGKLLSKWRLEGEELGQGGPSRIPQHRERFHRSSSLWGDATF